MGVTRTGNGLILATADKFMHHKIHISVSVCVYAGLPLIGLLIREIHKYIYLCLTVYLFIFLRINTLPLYTRQFAAEKQSCLIYA